MSRLRVSMDIGGTFTDIVAYDEQAGHYRAGKTSTTPDDLTQGVLTALGTAVSSPREVSFLVHGTTQGLNTFLQRRGVPVLLLATKGAEDIYHIARGPRTRLYDLHYVAAAGVCGQLLVLLAGGADRGAAMPVMPGVARWASRVGPCGARRRRPIRR